MNARAHRVGSALVVGLGAFAMTSDEQARMPNALVAGSAGAIFGTLPDLVEPACNPHHRQFFHSVAFLGALAFAAYRLHKWQPEEAIGKLLRAGGLVLVTAYGTHLVMDSFTSRSLPVIGRL